VTDNPVTSAPILTGLYVHNAEVRPGDGTGILKKAVSRVGSIVLKHSRNSFRLTFSCPDFASGGRNTFAYRLDGFDKSWIETRSREAVYSNLRKGMYRFELRVANSDGVWSPEEATLSIRVRPPWYGTLFAEICFAMVLLAGLIFLMNEILRRNNLRNAEAMEKMKERYERQVRHARVTAFLSDPSKQLGEADETFLCRVLDLIDAGLTHPQFSVETLAEKVGMTRSNLHLKMKTIAGISPIDLITRIRLEKAAELLRGGRLTMSEIAEETGFNSASYFSSCFRKATGLTPKDYAARFRTSD
jgi:AraC-like DNA-binding protein